MEELETDGLVVRETQTGTADKIITLLTPSYGRLSVSWKGASSLKKKYSASAQPFAYSTFQLRKKGDYYYVKEAAHIESFINIRYDIERLSLANYICDVACDIAGENEKNEELMRLVLNTFYAISNKPDIPNDLIKGAFEFRLASQEGFEPDLTVCGNCGKEIEGDTYLDVMNGRMICDSCISIIQNPQWSEDEGTSKIYLRLTAKTLSALRHIEKSDIKRFLSFRLEKEDLSNFSAVCEKYLLNHLEHNYKSLDYYKSIKI